MFVARVPTYGTCDAGRGFWKKLRHDILSTGLKENAVIRALYIYQEDGEPKSMLATHVDDMLWATKSGYEDRVQQLLDRYTIKTVESGTFRFCGREVIQHSDFSVSLKCKETTEKIEPVRYYPKGRKQTDLARDHEMAQLRSVVGSLAWVARQCRPQLSYGVNKLQSVCGTATLEDLKFANKLLQEASNCWIKDTSRFHFNGLTSMSLFTVIPQGPFESKCRKLSPSSCGWVLILSGQFKITLLLVGRGKKLSGPFTVEKRATQKTLPQSENTRRLGPSSIWVQKASAREEYLA